jgi:hypothetical protein
MPTIGSFSQDDLFGQEGTIETATLKAKVKFAPLRSAAATSPTTTSSWQTGHRRSLVPDLEEGRRLSLP